MVKRKFNRKTTKVLNILADGGTTSNGTDKLQGIGTAINSAGLMIGTASELANNSNTGDIESMIRAAESYRAAANNNEDLMSAWSSYSPLKEVSYEDVRGVSAGQQVGNVFLSTGQGALAGMIGGPLGALIGAGIGALVGGISNTVGDIKATKATKEYNERINTANNRNLESLQDRIASIDTQNDLSILANYSAYGGPLLFSKGGKIHIKPSKRGTFTAAAKKHGKSVQAFASRVLANKDKYSSAMVKKANFARNASKWKHGTGGYLYGDGGNFYTSIPNIGQHGGNFSNGVTIIGNGGTHEENPMEGVPMGVAPDGTPNLVEQGEVKFNNYVFSNRLFATGGLLAAHNLPATYANHSFADIAERLSKESSERPNDPISKRGLISAMTRLQQAQEQLRAEEQNRKFAKGGHLFAGGGPAGINPDLYSEDDYLINPTGSKIIGYDDTVETGVNIDSSQNTTPSRQAKQGRGASWLRYAPVVGSGIGVLTDIFGLTNKPDYTNADLIGGSVDNLTDIGFTPIGNYLTYRPLDRNYYINKLNAQAGATRRAIANQSGGNRATALAGLLAADYNALGRMGDLARQAEEYNQAQRERVEAFNRGTNQFNAEMALKAGIANQRNDELRLKARTAQAQLRDQADARASAGRTANLTNLFDSLGEIGREEFSRNMIQSNPALYYSIDRNGNITYKNGYEDLSEAEKKVVRDAANKAKGKKKAKGGYLTIRGGK